ncbi:MAG: fumarylacetoacetate hydrolase family protein [Steroidobacteraceae bacterium]
MGNDRRELIKLGLAGLAGINTADALAASSSAGRVNTQAPFPSGLTYATLMQGEVATLAIRTTRGLLNMAVVERERRLGLPQTTDELIQRRGNLNALTTLTNDAKLPARYFVDAAKATFGPCVMNPDKIICLGLNYRAHAAESGQAAPSSPILFNKYRTSLNAHGGTIRVSSESASKWDYEAELVIVMGRGGRNIPEAAALDYVFGYCVGQDFTARDLQQLTSQWMLGKCGDGWGPIGPWLVSADQVDPDNLDIQCSLNGEVRQSANTNMMIFNCRQMISYISRHMTLSPGDVIFTGTPEGVINGYPKDKQVWMKPGDKLVTSIEKLGEQRISLT